MSRPYLAERKDLPFDIEIEQALLGSCLVDNRIIADVAALCQPICFFDPCHDRIAEAIFALEADGKPVTPMVLGSVLSSDPGLKEIGGNAYLTGLMQAAPALPDHKQLARIVADLDMRREAIVAMEQSIDAAKNRTISPLEAMKLALEAADTAAQAEGNRLSANVSEAVAAVLQEAQDTLDGKRPPVVSSGLSTLDAIIGGFKPGDFAVAAGRPGMGKTALLLTTAIAAAMSGKPTVFFSLEMPTAQLLHRVGCQIDYATHASDAMSYSWFRSGDLKSNQVARMAYALQMLPKNLMIYDSGDLTIHEIAALSRAFAMRHQGLGLVVIDYLQQVRPTARYAGNKVQEVTEISNATKALAKRIGWPVLVGAQLSRAGEKRDDKRPTLSDLRESGAIEQDADQVIGLYREGYYVEKRKPATVYDDGYEAWQLEYNACRNRLDLMVLKNRHGETNNVSVWCDMRANAICDEKPMDGGQA